jgi:hypothetical protein
MPTPHKTEFSYLKAILMVPTIHRLTLTCNANRGDDGNGSGCEQRVITKRSLEEAKMRNNSRHLRNDAAKRCAVCGGKFGLIRHYSWRTALCSKKCVDRFKSREEADRRWLLRLQATRQTLAVGFMQLRSKEAAQ